MAERRGRAKENVAGEVYNSNAKTIGGGEIPTFASANPQPKHQVPEHSHWHVLYPNYVDSQKTLAQGRKISRQHACAAPIIQEMAEVCSYFKLQSILEPGKAYPRDWIVPGRLQVHIKSKEGKFLNPEIRSKQQLMKKMGELIPKLQSRKLRLQQEKEEKEAMLAANAKSSGAGSGKVSGKKKGKKKGRK